MNIAKIGVSAIGKLVALGIIVAAFLFGMAGVVYMSLQGKEVQVPDITGKDLNEADKELALLGLKIKKRADRVSQEKPGTVIEELPKPGETVKTGQMILVVTSRGPENGVVPPTVKTDEDDSEKIEELISDKPKKPKANSNTNKKKPDTSRDTNTAATNNNSSTSTGGESNSNKSEKPPANGTDKPKPSTTPGKTVDNKLKPKPGVQR